MFLYYYIPLIIARQLNGQGIKGLFINLHFQYIV